MSTLHPEICTSMLHDPSCLQFFRVPCSTIGVPSIVFEPLHFASEVLALPPVVWICIAFQLWLESSLRPHIALFANPYRAFVSQDVDSEQLLNEKSEDERIINAPRVRKAIHRFGMKSESGRCVCLSA